MEENKNVEKKKSSALPIVIVAIIFLGIGVGLGYVLFNGDTGVLVSNKSTANDNNSSSEVDDSTNNNSNDKEDNNNVVEDDSISDALLKELKNIANLDSNGPYSKLFYPFMFDDGVVADFDVYQKTQVVYRYAIKNNLTSKVEAGKYDYCQDGGMCVGLKINEFNAIAKKYGMSEFVPDIGYGAFKTHDDMYWGDLGGDVVDHSEVVHDISAEKSGNDIVLTDNMMFKGGDGDRNVTKVFTFKKSAETNEYYLYSVTTK